MDLDGWELLDLDEKTISRNSNSKSKKIFHLEDYFSPNPQKIITPTVPTQLVSVPIPFNPTIGNAPVDDSESQKQLEEEEEVTKLPIEATVVPAPRPEKILLLHDPPPVLEADQADAAGTHVYFVKMKENENQFVDMKMDSPKSGSRGAEAVSSPRMKIEMDPDAKEAVNWEESGGGGGGVNIWKWSLNGIGALCSFGVAAATVCIIIFGSQQRNKQQQQNQKPRFQIYADDKRIKQVVHQATRLNEVISATRGVPLARAHITFGGYYDGL